MKKKIIIGVVLVSIVLVGVFLKVKSTKYEPVEVSMDLTQIQDGTYEGASETNLVKVEVAVTIKEHKIKLLTLRNMSVV